VEYDHPLPAEIAIMHRLVTPPHLDEFTLLRYAVSDLEIEERGTAEKHLRGCERCGNALAEMEMLDREMSDAAREMDPSEARSDRDPFARRPEMPPRPAGQSAVRPENLAMIALEASEKGSDEKGRIAEAAKGSPLQLATHLSNLSLTDPAFRFAMLYALQEAGREIAEDPLRALRLAQATLVRLKDEPPPVDPHVERILPLEALAAQAHQLAGQGRTWTGELERAREHLEEAYQRFASSTGDEMSLAIVELCEAQRRAFAGDPQAGLRLAERSEKTFADMGLEDFAARARVAEGICLSKLGREPEALASFQSAAPVFRRLELWSNYVGAVNAVGACLARMGRLDEARSEYARVLRTVSHERHAAWVGYIRNGLATVLFEAGRHREAALAFAQTLRVFQVLRLLAHALTAALFEIESWALAGDNARAAHRLDIFRAEVARHGALDPAIVRRLEAALSGADPDFEEVARLRQDAGQRIRERLLG
jgi:tetratricopeptide (TPR) repeat protein